MRSLQFEELRMNYKYESAALILLKRKAAAIFGKYTSRMWSNLSTLQQSSDGSSSDVSQINLYFSTVHVRFFCSTLSFGSPYVMQNLGKKWFLLLFSQTRYCENKPLSNFLLLPTPLLKAQQFLLVATGRRLQTMWELPVDFHVGMRTSMRGSPAWDKISLCRDSPSVPSYL